MKKPARQCAEHFGVDSTTATRWYAQVEYDRAKGKLQAFLNENFPVEDRELPTSHFDWDTAHIPLLLDGFLAFREKFFKTPRHTPYETPGFQQAWASSLSSSLVDGDMEMILAPQRHGKTMLLAHFCTYLMCLDPNVRILWISAAQRTAEKSVNLVRSILASNQELIEEYAGVGNTFIPDRKSPYQWTRAEFTVATRTDVDLNGPNMQALGREGTILSLNADIIIVDDIEDKGSVGQIGTRESTKEWWDSQLLGRKEEHTGVFVIGSRQHADDLYSHILVNDEYNVTVEQAHNPACPIPEHDHEAHVDCMLFPEVRTHKWLIKQKRAMNNPARWEMIYQNVARTAGLVVFPEDQVKACRSASYRARTMPAHSSYRLVAGLDPAISGFQAAVLLAYQTVPELKIWLVDLDNTEGGGVGAAARLIRRWYDKYKVSHWVAEENLLGDLNQYQEIQEAIRPHGIYVQTWHTGHNKNQEYFGVTGLSTLFEEKQIILPYADAESQMVTDTLVSQLVVWDEANSRNKNRTGFKDDLVMALWQAWDPIRRARHEFNAVLGVDMSDPLTAAFDDGLQEWDDWDIAS